MSKTRPARPRSSATFVSAPGPFRAEVLDLSGDDAVLVRLHRATPEEVIRAELAVPHHEPTAGVAKALTTRRSILKSIKGSNSVDISPEDSDLGSDDAAISSVLPTTLLYDALYLQADVQIGFQPLIAFGTAHVPPVHKMVNDYAKRVHQAAIAALNKSGKATMPRALGTAGKIWAIHPDMERRQWSRLENRRVVCAINYGFHKTPPNPTAEAFQSPGTNHGTDHTDDYSQVFVAVAGYCAVRASSSDPLRWRKTAEVFTSTATPSFAPLVAKGGKPLPQSAYGGPARGEWPPDGKPWTPVP
jgi:hypothetical protein